MKDVMAMLGKCGIKAAVIVVAEGATSVKFYQGRKLLAHVGTRMAAKTVLRYVARFGLKSLPWFTAIYAGGKAHASGGDNHDVAMAIGRDVMIADIAEGVFQMTVIAGCDKIGEALVRPVEHAELKYSQLDDEQREGLVAWVRNFFENLPAWNEGADFMSDGIWNPKPNQKAKF